MQSLRTAIEIKNALDNAPKNLKPIGTCEQTILEWKMETYGEGYNEEEDEKFEKIQKLKDSLKGNYNSMFEFSEEEREYSISLGDHSNNLNITQDTLKEIYEKAEESPFGDVKNQETKVDKNVRDAREINDISVDPKIIEKIEEEWSKNMIPSQVKVVPYKLNMYTKNGKFEEHLDTPEKDLVGTALVSLWDSSANINSHLTVYDVNKDRLECWRPDSPSCMMFYTDCPHKVQKGYTYGKDENIRATLAFKVYVAGETDKDEDKIRSVSNALQQLSENSSSTLGFILEHSYSLTTESLKGSDVVLLEALKRNGFQFMLIPILYHFTLSSYHQGDDEFKSLVYSLREEEIDYLISLEKNEKDKQEKDIPFFPYEDIDFYILNEKYHVWKNLHNSYCEHTGNEARPEDEDSIYLSRALIVYK